MKKLTQFILEANLDINDGGMNFIPKAKLEKYMEVCEKFLSPESMVIVKYLIDHNDTYVQDFSNGKKGNALEIFYAAGVPKDGELKTIYKCLGVLNKKNMLLEIPVFQDEDTFEDILAKKVSLDEVVLDLDSEAGRSACVKKYTPLVWKVARSFIGRSNFDLDELVGYGFEGLTKAMNQYGKKTQFTNVDEECVKSTKFFSFAAFRIRSHILDSIVGESHLVHVPKNQQDKERQLTGRNTKSYSTSGDQTMGHDDNGNAKSMFDYMGAEAGSEEGGRSMDMEDKAKLWNGIFKALEEKFDEQTLDIWYSLYGIRGHKKMKNKDIAAKYNMGASRVTYYAVKVNQYILTDKKLKNAIEEIRDLMTAD